MIDTHPSSASGQERLNEGSLDPNEERREAVDQRPRADRGQVAVLRRGVVIHSPTIVTMTIHQHDPRRRGCETHKVWRPASVTTTQAKSLMRGDSVAADADDR